VAATADDQVLAAPGEIDEAVGVHVGEVAGIEPAVGDLPGRVRAGPVRTAGDVPGEDRRAADRQDASLAGGQVGPRSGVFVDSDRFDALVGQALAD
jgi:hypothetical protein